MNILLTDASTPVGAALARRLKADPTLSVTVLEGAPRTAAAAPMSADTDVVVDLSYPPLVAGAALRRFMDASTRHLLAAAVRTSARHYIALSVVGAGQAPRSDFFEAKAAQEHQTRQSGLPFSILRVTPVFENLPAVARAAIAGAYDPMSTVPTRPVAAEDVAQAVADLVHSGPVNDTLELGGPEVLALDDTVVRAWKAGWSEIIETEPTTTYFGDVLDGDVLMPQPTALVGRLTLDDWRLGLRPITG